MSASRFRGLDDLVLQVKGLVIVRELLQERGTDVTALDREIDRLRGLERRPDLPTTA